MEDNNLSMILESTSPMTILDCVAENIIDVVRSTVVEYFRVNQTPPESAAFAIESTVGSTSITIHSDADSCRITAALDSWTSSHQHVDQLLRRSIRCGPFVNINASPVTIKITRCPHPHKPSPASSRCPSLSWLYAMLDIGTTNSMPTRRGAPEILDMVLARLKVGIQCIDRLSGLATGLEIERILDALKVLKEMDRVLNLEEKKKRREMMETRKRRMLEMSIDREIKRRRL